MEYSYKTNKITYKGQLISLAPIENEILNFLYNENRNKVCSIEEIALHIYGRKEESDKNTTRVWVCRLRNKVKGIINIRTVYKKGFIID